MAEVVGPLLVIVGETSSGKSSLALELAERLNGEIICADSWTVYKDFEIGTAKPSAAERAKIPHHLLDVTTADKGYNAVRFKEQAQQAILDISSRGKLPIMVGGTGLYVDSVLFDYQFLPPTDPGLRAVLDAMSLDDLLARAADEGIDTSIIDARNKRRVVRLIENKGQLPTQKPMREHTLVLGMKTEPAELARRVTQRVDAMIAAGLEQEVRSLKVTYGWDVEPMKGIGYKEWQAYISGTQNLEMTRQKIIKNTLDLAKRQRTWFKRNKSIQWIENRGELPTIVDFVTTQLYKV